MTSIAEEGGGDAVLSPEDEASQELARILRVEASRAAAEERRASKAAQGVNDKEAARMAEEAVAAAALQAEKNATAKAEADLAAAAEQARQMALRALEEAEAERERMSSMSEAELVAMHLDTKVTSDLQVCAKDLEQTQATLKAVEDQESDLEQCLGANRNVMGSDISKVEEMIEGLDAALLVNVHFQEQSAALALQVDGEVVATSQKLLDHQSVLADRVNKELAEARHRLSAQNARQRTLQEELDKYKLSVETDMAKQSTELKRLNAIEATKRLNEEMWQSHLSYLSAKLEELCQAKSDHASIRQKEEFVEETGRQVEALTQRIDDDEDKLRKWRTQEEEVREPDLSAQSARARCPLLSVPVEIATHAPFVSSCLRALIRRADSGSMLLSAARSHPVWADCGGGDPRRCRRRVEHRVPRGR